MADNPVLSRSREDYLKVIYDLEARFGIAQTSAIAEEMDLAPASVSPDARRSRRLLCGRICQALWLRTHHVHTGHSSVSIYDVPPDKLATARRVRALTLPGCGLLWARRKD